MKKYIYILLFMLIFFTLLSCEKEIKNVDNIPPLIIIEPNYLNVNITVGTKIDLMLGVSGIDNIDGNITHLIEIDDRDLNINIPGTYTIYYYLADKSNNQAAYKTKEVTVINSHTNIIDYPIYNGKIENEICPLSSNCFNGAWYYKVVSSKDEWLGIVGTITLPIFNADPNRDTGNRFLDNPSIYMGGNAGYESDAGLSLSLVTINNGSSISTYSIAFRPFWRYITIINKDEGGYDKHDGKYSVSCTNNNCYGNWHYSQSEFYYLPGDKIKMSVFSPQKNYLQLKIDVIAISNLPESISLRTQHGWKNPADFTSPMFYSSNHSIGKAEFKRVNAIDQVSNEGKPAIPTLASVLNANWESSFLIRKINNQLMRIPLTDERRFVLACPNAEAIIITQSPQQITYGGETVSIQPNKIKNKED